MRGGEDLAITFGWEIKTDAGAERKHDRTGTTSHTPRWSRLQSSSAICLGFGLALGGSLLGDLRTLFRRRALRLGCAALLALRFRRRVFAIIDNRVLSPAGQHLHDVDSVGDHSVGRFWPLGPVGTILSEAAGTPVGI